MNARVEKLLKRVVSGTAGYEVACELCDEFRSESRTAFTAGVLAGVATVVFIICTFQLLP